MIVSVSNHYIVSIVVM